ncbi:MAG: AAA family ATPase [Phycisphaerae bacterium]
MITKMHIEQFKCFKRLDIEFGQFNVLIGPNDSGKSSLLQAIQLAPEQA